MEKILGLIFGILFIVVVGVFAVWSCTVSSECSRYEGYHRKDYEDERIK